LRFLRKILTDTEIEQVRNSCNPDTALWSFWACNEAAYKVIQKKTSGAAFVPRRWSVHYQARVDSPGGLPPAAGHYGDGEVVIANSDPVYLRLFTFPSYIHCLAADESRGIDQIMAHVDAIPERTGPQGTDPSLFVRMRLIRSLAGDLCRPEEDLRIIREKKKDGLGPPVLYIADAPSAIDLSISHDGRYVAYAYIV